jgi:ADP-heptose:LPS heptosyltransferase
VSGVRFFSLQQGAEARAYANAAFAIEPLSEHTCSIVAAAAAMLKLDLVVTVDAMTAHLAGALGRPVWVALKHDPDWRWMSECTESPWYPTMRLFRQPQPGDWGHVAQAIAQRLSASHCHAARISATAHRYRSPFSPETSRAQQRER